MPYPVYTRGMSTLDKTVEDELFAALDAEEADKAAGVHSKAAPAINSNRNIPPTTGIANRAN